MSSPLFAPFSIPLLLEKLSSSLRMAKVCIKLNGCNINNINHEKFILYLVAQKRI
jgi:hypothetical protein